MEEKDIQLINSFRKSPLKFIRAIWNLNPPRIKDNYKDIVELLVKHQKWSDIKPEYFEPFVKGEEITWQQWLFFLAVEKAINGEAPRKISIVSGHGTGKSVDLTWLIVWFLMCHPDAQVGATAPTSEQIHDVLWKEIAVWLDRMPSEIKNLFDWSAGYLRIKERPNTWFARARTARKEAPEAIAGLHGEYVMLDIDEASGVPDEIFRSAEGSLTGKNTLVVLTGNGTRNQGYFYDTHHNDKENWQILSFNSEDSPIVEDNFVQRMLSKYGRESDEYKVRVLGQFPSSEQMDVSGWIPLLTDNQVTQVSETPFMGRKWLGIDPSGEGDDTTRWVMRDRFMAKVIQTEITSNDKTIAKKTYEIIKRHELNPNDVTTGNFGVGADVRAELLLLDHKMDIRTINEGDKATDDVYLNIRAEMCFRGRTWMIRGGAVVGDDLKRDMLAFKYKNNIKGVKQILDKPNLKQLLGRSPDRADAFFMTFAYDESLDMHSNEQVQGTMVNQTTYSDLHAPI